MKKRKPGMILVTHGFPFGESERSFLYSEFLELKKRFKVTVMAVLPAGSERKPLDKELAKGCRIIRVRYGRFTKLRCLRVFTDRGFFEEVAAELKAHRAPWHQVIRYHLISVNRSFAVKKALERAIRSHGADIIYTYWCTEETYAALMLKKRYPELRVISRLHGYDLYRERGIAGLQPMHRFIAERADRLVFVSHSGMEYFNKEYPGGAPRTVSYLGCRGFRELPAERALSMTVMSCSAVVPVKRVELIVQALALLGDLGLRWVHIGDGELLEEVKVRADKLLKNSGCSAHFIGSVPNDRLGEIYSRFSPDVFINASWSEGIPISIAEAFSCGVPAIAPAVGGIPEIISDGHNGFLLSEELSPEELARAIRRFYELSEEQRRDLCRCAAETFREGFDARKNAQGMADLLEKS